MSSKPWLCWVLFSLFMGGQGAFAAIASVFPEMSPLEGENEQLAQVEGVYLNSFDECEREAEALLGVEHARPRNRVELQISRERNAYEPGLLASTSGYGRNVKIEVYLKAHLPGLFHARSTLCHELIHGLMRKHVSSYPTLPAWVREGSATYFSGEWDFRFSEHLVKSHRAEDGPVGAVESIVADGRRGQDFSIKDYFESAGFFAYLDSEYTGGARTLVRYLVVGLDIEQATRALTGRTVVDVLESAKNWVKLQLSVELLLWPSGMSEISAGKNSRGVRLTPQEARVLYDQAMAELTARLSFVSEGERGVTPVAVAVAAGVTAVGESSGETAEAATQELLRAQAGERARRIFEISRRMAWLRYFFSKNIQAIGAFQSVATEVLAPFFETDREGVFVSAAYGIPMSEVFYDRAYLHRMRGDHASALLDYQRVWRYHTESPNLRAGAVVGMGKSHFDQGDFAMAFAWLNPRADVNLTVEPETCWYLVRAALAVGERARAQGAFAVLDQNFGASPLWRDRVQALRAALVP